MDVYRALWRRRFLIAFLTLATVVSTYVVVSRQTKIYESSSLIRVQQRVSDPSQAGTALGIAQHLAQTYAQIVVTDEIKGRIYRQLHGRVPPWNISLSAQPVQDLELLYVNAKSSDPKTAALVANAAPRALQAFIAEQPESLRDEIQVINPAGVSSSPISPRMKSSLIIAFLAGLVFNGALALLIEFLSDRLPEADDLEMLTGKPLLATVPPLTFRPVGSTWVPRVAKEPAADPPPPQELPPRRAPRTQAQPRRSRG
jgi:polysaccharide biosynthesis transport protein